MPVSSLTVHVFDSFDAPALRRERWNRLLGNGQTDVVFLTHEWQTAWWQSFGRGRLLLILIERDGKAVAAAPLFADRGMIFFVSSGGSDYLDFVGDVGDPEVLAAILDTARGQVADFVGFRFYHVPEASRTGARLQAIAGALDLVCHGEETLGSPRLDPRGDSEMLRVAADKKSLRRHQRWFLENGELRVTHLSDGAAILPHLDAFFAQHVRRWMETNSPSLFVQENQRAFYRRLCREAAESSWLRFTRIDWNEDPIAFHFGSCHRGRYLWYKPSFAVELARRSPGEVLLRELLLAAEAERVEMFDLGLGTETFKARFQSHVAYVRTWGLYPASICREHNLDEVRQ